MGACGIESNDNGAVVAVSHITFDAAQKGSDPNQNPLCGRKIRARRVREDGKTVSIDVTVVDRCKWNGIVMREKSVIDVGLISRRYWV